MNSFTLHLQDATKYQKIDNIISFVGQDLAGKFGLMANHERFITALGFGLAKYKDVNHHWTYVALPGGILHFVNNELYITTRQYLVDENYEKISQELGNRIRKEEEKTKVLRESLHKLEQSVFKRLWDVGRLET